MQAEEDAFVRRARPSFLYLMYLVILLCVFGGVVGIWAPDAMARAATTTKSLLGAVPEPMWWLFATCYLGYAAGRSFDKRSKAKFLNQTEKST